MARTPKATTNKVGEGVRLWLLTTEFNADITDAMRRLALETAKRVGATVVVDVRAPGVYDTPLLAKAMLARPDVHGVVVLGAVVTGQTRHDEVVAFGAARALTELALSSGKPVGLGITGPGQTRAQAKARIDRAAWAVESVCKQFTTLLALRRPDG